MSNDIDPVMKADLEAVAQMVKLAEENGLLVEAVLFFGHEREHGADTQNACAAALYEWDLI